MSEELAILYAKNFIQRRDVKAVQFANGAYSPDTRLEHLGHHGPHGFTMDHLDAHLAGTSTYGHYLLDAEDNARMFCYDLDLKTEGFWVPMTEGETWPDPIAYNPREAWQERHAESRAWVKTQMGMLARKLCAAIQKELNIGTAAAYSGNKGLHIYGFTGVMPAQQIRAAAHYVLLASDDWVLERGQHIYQYKLQDPVMGYPNFNLEVYPKQDSLENKDLGNLLRLPLGRNLKSEDPTFFLDLRTAPGEMVPHPDPVGLLTSGDPFA